MRCGDLERYLEAFLDGRLGRSRRAVLRRHLALCAACQARVERLRQFERDTQRRFRELERTGSVWEGLELDLVASSRASAVSRTPGPPACAAATKARRSRRAPVTDRRAVGHPILAARPKMGRGHASRVVGVLFLAMALGTLYQVGRTYLQPDGELAVAYGQFVHDARAPAMRSADAQQLQAWLATELGLDVPIPPAPAGYRLAGADIADFTSGEAGMLIYEEDGAGGGGPVLLFVRPRTAQPPASSPAVGGGLEEISWETATARYTLVGHEPAEEFRQFVR